MAEISLNVPAPRCGVTNSFTGVVVEQESQNSRSAARVAALRAARAAMAPRIAMDEALGCPPECNGRSNLTTIGLAGVQTIEVDPDNSRWVSQHRGHWMVELRCGRPRTDPAALVGVPEFTVVRHEEPLVCGTIRRSLGCVISRDIKPSSLAARNGARDAARNERDRLQAEDLAKLCPKGCLEKPVTRSGGGSRLVIARRVRQAGRVWVAYWTAWWWVEHKCIPTEKRKEPRYEPKRKRGYK